jgi:peptidoglycan biosynthesis protein MviN/MurJ (putative lipid II flippase)
MSGPRRSPLASGILTGLGQVASAGAAAGAAVLLAHRFGRNAQTDGFLTAYGVYLVLGLAAQSFRLVVVPELTRARAAGRLASETRSYALAFLGLSALLSAAAIALAGPFADLLTASPAAQSEAKDALRVLVPAAFLQLFAALFSSALAALDSYTIAAIGYGVGAVLGLVVFAALSGSHGLITLAWGVLAGGLFTALLPALVLARYGNLFSGAPAPLAVGRRIFQLARGAAVPIAVQGMYVVSLRLAAGLGVGLQTSLSYGYVIAATLVAATAASLSLISSAPLTRRGVDAESAAAHVVHAAWLSLAAIAAATGIFALVGGKLIGGALGHAYTGNAGSELGRLVVYLAPWMVVMVAYTVVFPLVFVVEKPSVLLPLAPVALALHIPISLALRSWLGLNGLALALAVTTALVLVVLLAAVSPRMLELAALGLGRVALGLGALAAAAFGLVSLALTGIPAAAAGLALYAAVLAAARPRGLREAWAYVRVLH